MLLHRGYRGHLLDLLNLWLCRKLVAKSLKDPESITEGMHPETLHNADLFTTFPLKRWERYKHSVLSWRKVQFLTIKVLVTQPEIDTFTEVKEELEANSINCHVVPAPPSRSRGSKDATFVQPSSAPSILELLDLFNTSLGERVLIYVNADIYLPHDEIERLKRYIGLSLSQRTAIFFRRHNCLNYSDLFPTVYEDGYDMFMLHTALLSGLRREPLSEFRIGQVGWDYALPLSFPRHAINQSTNLTLRHIVHESGSTSSWDVAMINAFRCTHMSYRSMLIPSTILNPKISSFLSRFCSHFFDTGYSKSKLISFARWAIARIIFYLHIKPSLESIARV